MAKTKKAPWYYLKRSDGEASLAATLVLISFWVTTIVYILTAFESIFHISMKDFDVTATSVYLIPILGNYWARRNTESKANTASEKIQQKAVESIEDKEDQSE